MAGVSAASAVCASSECFPPWRHRALADKAVNVYLLHLSYPVAPILCLRLHLPPLSTYVQGPTGQVTGRSWQTKLQKGDTPGSAMHQCSGTMGQIVACSNTAQFKAACTTSIEKGNMCWQCRIVGNVSQFLPFWAKCPHFWAVLVALSCFLRRALAAAQQIQPTRPECMSIDEQGLT